MSDDEIRTEWELAKRMQRAANRYELRYRSVLNTPTQGPGLAARLVDRILERMEAAGVTVHDLDRLGLG